MKARRTNVTTPENRSKAVAMRADGAKVADIAKALGASDTTVFYWLNPGKEKDRRERKNAIRRQATEDRNAKANPRFVTSPRFRPDVTKLPPVPADTRDLTAKFCGDPLPGRSVLDKMKAKGKWGAST